MPISYTLYNHVNLVVSIARGETAGIEYLEYYSRLYSDPLFTPGSNELIDIRQAELKDVGPDLLREVAKLTADINKGLPTKSAIVTSDKLQFGVSRAYAAYSSLHADEESRPFRTLSEAFAWLEVEEFPIE